MPCFIDPSLDSHDKQCAGPVHIALRLQQPICSQSGFRPSPIAGLSPSVHCDEKLPWLARHLLHGFNIMRQFNVVVLGGKIDDDHYIADTYSRKAGGVGKSALTGVYRIL